MPIHRRRTSRYLLTPAFAACWLVIAGCAAPNPQPFNQFALAVTGLKGDADDTLNAEIAVAKGRYEGKAVQNSADFEALFLNLDSSNPYGWTWGTGKTPHYMHVVRFKVGMGQFNDAFAQYASLLAQLAGSDLVKQADFDKIAADLNSNLDAAAKTLKMDTTATGQGIALFSAAASEAAHAYIEHKRTSDLIAVLQKNQPMIETFAAQGEQATLLITQEWEKDYVDRKNDWTAAYVDAKDDAAKKTAVITALLKENDNYVNTIDTLHALSAAYAKIPAAHKELLDSLQQKKALTTQISLLVTEIKHIQSLYSQLKPAAQK